MEVVSSIINESMSSIRLEMLSSFTLGAITPFIDGMAPETMLLHRLRSTWSAEGRLVSETLEELQLEPSWLHSAFVKI